MTNGVRQMGLGPTAAPTAPTPPTTPTPAMPGLSRLATLGPERLPVQGDAAFNPLVERQRSFAGVLSRAAQHPGAPASPEAKAREGAEQFVAITFLQPLLKQLRESNHTAAPFAPSSGEKQMQGIMDAELAQRLAKAQRWPLVDRVAHDLLKKASADETPRQAGKIE